MAVIDKAITTPITTYQTDREIVEAVQTKVGTGFSGAVRFIIRDWARISGYTESKSKKSRSVKVA